MSSNDGGVSGCISCPADCQSVWTAFDTFLTAIRPLFPNPCCSRNPQIRTGDSVLFDHHGGRIKNFDSYAAYFNCAAQVEETQRLDANQRVHRLCCGVPPPTRCPVCFWKRRWDVTGSGSRRHADVSQQPPPPPCCGFAFPCAQLAVNRAETGCPLEGPEVLQLLHGAAAAG